MRNVLLILLFAFIHPVYCQQVVDQELESKIDSIFLDWNDKETPGGIISVISEGEVIFQKSYGSYDIKKKTSITETTPFNLASVAKQFTAMCIALLEEEGKLSIEDNISKYFPEFQFEEEIKIRNLLDHSSGIRAATVIGILAFKGINLSGELPQRLMNNEYLRSIIANDRDLNFPPGTESAYTNDNYMLLADVVEQVSGQPFAEYIENAIFKPLGMKNTYVVSGVRDGSEIIGYGANGEKFKRKKIKSHVVGDGNIISTIEDMQLWSLNFLDNKLGKKDPTLVEKMSTSFVLNDGSKSNYGYGLNILDFNGMKLVQHGGEDYQHTSHILWLPNQNFSVIGLSNAAGDWNDPSGKSREILNIFFGDNKEVGLINEEQEFKYEEVSESEISKRSGLYYKIDEDGLAQLRQVSVEEGNLHISLDTKRKFKFQAINKNHYFFKKTSGKIIHIRFEPLGNEEFLLKEGFWRYDKDVEFKKSKTYSFKQQEYKGSYRERNHDTVFKIKVKGDRVIAKKSILKIPLVQLDEDVFLSPEYSATFSFYRNGSGKVEKMKINASDFRNFNLWRE